MLKAELIVSQYIYINNSCIC